MNFDHPDQWVRWRFREFFGDQFAQRVANRSPFVTDEELKSGFLTQMRRQAEEWGLPEVPSVSW